MEPIEPTNPNATDAAAILEKSIDALSVKLEASIEAFKTTEGEERSKLEASLKSMSEQIEGLTEVKTTRPDFSGIEVTKKGEPDKFSFGRMFKMLVEPHLFKEKEYGYEAEVYEHTRSLQDDLPGAMKTSINAATDGAGAFLIPDQVMAQLIPELESMEIAQALGMTTVNNLSGNVSWVVDEGGIAASYLNTEEEQTGAETVSTFSSFEMVPHVLAAFVPVTWAMMTQSAISVDQFVTGRLAKKIALREDLSVFLGDSGASEPLGLFNHAGIQSLDWDDAPMSGPSFGPTAQTVSDGLRLNYKLLTDANVTIGGDISSVGWAASPAAAFGIAATKDADSKPLFLGPNDGMISSLLGRPFQISSQLDSGDDTAQRLLCGDFSEAILGRWGTIAFAASGETETNFRKVRTTIRAVMAHDVGVFHQAAFVNNIDLDVDSVV